MRLPAWNGEMVADLDGVELTLRPTFGAVRQIENITGRSLLVLNGEFEIGAPRLSTIATVVACGANAAKALNPATKMPWTVDEIGERILGPTLTAWAEIACALLGHLLSQGQQGRAAVGEASAAVLSGLLKQIDGRPVTPSPSTGDATTPPASAPSA